MLAAPALAKPGAAPLSSSDRCAALESWQEATADLTEREDNRELRGEVYYELQRAERLSWVAEPDFVTWRQCEESLEHLLELLPKLAAKEGLKARVEKERNQARAMAEAMTPPPPPVDPVEEWTRKRRRLQIQTGFSGAFTAAGLLIAFLPLPFRTCSGSPPEEYCQHYVPLIITVPVGLVMAAAAAIPLAIYGSRLRDHNRNPPRRAHVRITPLGLSGKF